MEFLLNMQILINLVKGYISMKRKSLIYVVLLFVLCGCQSNTKNNELSDYYLSMTSSSQVSDTEILVENQIYDFEEDVSISHDKFTLTAQYSLAVYDKKDNAILYSAKDASGEDDQVFLYDIETKQTKQLTNNLWGINYIIPRDNDYLVVGVPFKSHILCLWTIDRNTKKVSQVEIPNNDHDDMSVWQIAYIPQTNDVVIQAYSDSEQYEISHKWNSIEEHEESEELSVPYYHYIYKDGEAKYLFTKIMPQSDGLVSNGKDVLIAVNSKVNGDYLMKYNLDNNKLETLKNISGLGRVFYLDTAGEYVYAFKNGVGRKNINTGEEEWLDTHFKDLGSYSNYIFLKK